MAKTGRKVTGSLYKKNGKWYVAWMAFGVRNQRSTGIPVGRGSEAKENRKLAEAKRDEFVGAYKVEDEADVRASLVERQRAAQEVADEKMALVVAEANRIPLTEAWQRFPYDTSQPTRGRTAIHPLSKRNIRENELAWNKFLTWAKETHGSGLAMQDVTTDLALAYSKYLQSQGYTPSRHNLLILVCRVMYRLAGVPDPFSTVPKLAKQKAQGRLPFEKEQVATMLAAARGEWRGFLAVLYFTGLRAGDAVLLTYANRINGRIRVTTAKTEAEVVLTEHPELTKILDDTIDRHPPNKNTPLFPKLASLYREKGIQAISRQFETFMTRTLGTHQIEEDGSASFIPFEGTEERKRGIRKISRYGLHSFRHALATAAAQGGVPLASVQRWLGHASQTVTQIYTNHGSVEENQKMVAALSLSPVTSSPLALPPASGADSTSPSTPSLLKTDNQPPAIMDALERTIGELEKMTADDWETRRDRSLAILTTTAEAVRFWSIMPTGQATPKKEGVK